MRARRRVVKEERLVRHQRLLLAHPFDGVIGDVLVEVVALLGCLGLFDRRRALVQVRQVPVGLGSEEAVEVLEPAPAGRPLAERPELARLPHRHLMALPDLRSRIPVQREDLRQRRRAVRAKRAVTRRRGRELSDRAHPDRVVVTAGQQTLPGRRAQRGDMKPVVCEPACCEAIRGGRRRRPAERAHRAIARVVQQNQQHIRCTCGRTQRLDRRELRIRVPRVV